MSTRAAGGEFRRGPPRRCMLAAVRPVTAGPRAPADERWAMRPNFALRLAALWAVPPAVLLACGGESATPVELCTALLLSKVPAAEVVAVAPEPPDRLEIAYAVSAGGEAPPATGLLACELERSRLGGQRLRAAVLDGRPLSETELVVRNSNLLLDELYAIGKRS